MRLRPASTCRGRRCRRPSLHRERVAPSRGGRPWRAHGCRPRRRRRAQSSGSTLLPPHQRCCVQDDSHGTKSVRRNPDEARSSLADPFGGALVRPPPEARTVRSEHEHARIALGHDSRSASTGCGLQTRSRSTLTASEWASSAGLRSAPGDPRSRCSRTRPGSSASEGSAATFTTTSGWPPRPPSRLRTPSRPPRTERRAWREARAECLRRRSETSSRGPLSPEGQS